MRLLIHRGAGSHDLHAPAILVERERWPGLRVETCATPAELVARARAAVEEGEDTLFAGGGDGTVSAVVNAVGAHLSRIRLGVVPLGTGNDFARTLGLPLDPFAALDAQVNADGEVALDLLRVDGPERSVLCLNHASGGLGGLVEEVVDGELKRRWRSLAYVRAGADAVTERPAWDLSYEVDGGPTEERRVVNVVVANGQTAGGGFRVAPDADPADHRLDLVLVDDAPTLDLAGVAARLLAGDYTASEHVTVRRARAVTIRALPPMPFSVDGELFGHSPLTFRELPGALRVLRARPSSS